MEETQSQGWWCPMQEGEPCPTGQEVAHHTTGFSNLPDELTIRIFKYLQPIEDQLPILALVCRKWRHILRTTRSLWRGIHVDPTYYGFWHFCMLDTIFRVYGHHIQKLTWKDNAPVYESAFALLPNLRSLKFLRLPILWTRAVVESLAPLGELEYVQINGGYTLTDNELALIAKFYPKLKEVTLNACWAVTAMGINNFLGCLPNLTSAKLKINSGLQLNDHRSERAMMEGATTMNLISQSLPQAGLVTVLCLHFVPIELDELWTVINSLSNLKKLSISNCEVCSFFSGVPT